MSIPVLKFTGKPIVAFGIPMLHAPTDEELALLVSGPRMCNERAQISFLITINAARKAGDMERVAMLKAARANCLLRKGCG